MKIRLLLIILMLISIESHSQSINTFQDKDGNWGVKKGDKEVVEAEYTSFDSTSFNSLSFYIKDVLAIVVSEKGEILFEADDEVVQNSNAYIQYFIKEPEKVSVDYKTIEEEISNSVFLYLSDAVIDTMIIRIDTMTIGIEILNSGEKLPQGFVSIQAMKVLTKGDISIVNGKGELLNKKLFQDINILAYETRNPEYTYDYPPNIAYYYYINSNNDWYINNENHYYINIPPLEISKDNFIFKQNNKWGVYSFFKGEVIPPIYDSIIPDTHQMKLYNNNVLSAIVDSSGNYLYKAGKNIVKGSNAFMRLQQEGDYDDNYSLEKELKSYTYLYFNDAILDRVIISVDTLEFGYEQLNYGEEISEEAILLNTSIRLTKGYISVVDNKGSLLNKVPFDNISFRQNKFNEYLADDETRYFHYDLKNKNKFYDKSEGGALGLELYTIEIDDNYFCFQQNNKWGLFDIEKGYTLPAIFDNFEYDDSNEETFFYKNDLLGAVVDSLGIVKYEVEESVLNKNIAFLDFSIFLDQGDSYYQYYSNLYLYLSDTLTETVIISDTLEFYNQDTGIEFDSIVSIINLPVYRDGKIIIKDFIGNINIEKAFDEVFYFTPKMYYNSEVFYIENRFMEDVIGRFISVKSTKEYIQKNKYYFVNGRNNIKSNFLLAKRKNKWFLVELKSGSSIKVTEKLVGELLKTEFNRVHYNIEKEIIETELNEVIILYNLKGEIIQY